MQCVANIVREPNSDYIFHGFSLDVAYSIRHTDPVGFSDAQPHCYRDASPDADPVPDAVRQPNSVSLAHVHGEHVSNV